MNNKDNNNSNDFDSGDRESGRRLESLLREFAPAQLSDSGLSDAQLMFEMGRARGAMESTGDEVGNESGDSKSTFASTSESKSKTEPDMNLWRAATAASLVLAFVLGAMLLNQPANRANENVARNSKQEEVVDSGDNGAIASESVSNISNGSAGQQRPWTNRSDMGFNPQSPLARRQRLIDSVALNVNSQAGFESFEAYEGASRKTESTREQGVAEVGANRFDAVKELLESGDF